MLRSWAIFRGVLLPRLSLQVALGVGVAGALVDVSSFARLDDGLLRRWGRDDAFSDLEPGTFSFVLDNADGRFTPENPSSPLVTKLSEGARACVSVGGRLTAGTVRSVEPEFPGGSAAWATVRVTCDDMLGTAARTQFSNAWDALVEAAGPLGYWKFNEPVGSAVSIDSGPLGLPPFAPDRSRGIVPDFGAQPLPFVGETQARSNAAGTLSNRIRVTPGITDFGYPTGSGGWYSLWFTPLSNAADSSTDFIFTVTLRNGTELALHYGISGGLVMSANLNGILGPSMGSITINYGRSVLLQLEVTRSGSNVRGTFWVDGTQIGTNTAAAGVVSSSGLTPESLTLELASTGSASDKLFSRVSHTLTRPSEELLRSTAGADMYRLLDATVDGFTFASLPTDLSEATLERPDFENAAALDVLNDLLLAEQGDAYVQTTGTLTNPTDTVVVRARQRPRTVSYSFDVERELSGAPDFVRDLSNLRSAVRVSNSTRELVVEDRDLRERAGNSTDSESLLFLSENELRAWGQDRLIRGANTQMRIASVVIDAMTTPTDRSADLLALIPGDRVQFTNLPSPILGFSTWDGWFLGARETHTTERHEFELFFTPVLADTAVYDTDRYVDDVLTLSAGINAAVTSMSIATTGAKLTTTDLPLTVKVDNEQMTVTACTSATPQVATVTRGANGTTAASHSSAAAVTVLPNSIYAF